MFRVMKGQTDAIARVNKESRDARELIAGRGAAEEQRKTEVASLVRKYHAAGQEAATSPSAEKVAMQAKHLDPDNPAMAALHEMAKMSDRVQRRRADQEPTRRSSSSKGSNDAERTGPFVDIDNPVAFQLEACEACQRTAARATTTTCGRERPAEYEIELKLDKPISIEFSQTPLESGHREPPRADQAAAGDRSRHRSTPRGSAR